MKKKLENCLRCKKEINIDVDNSQKYYICPKCNVSCANPLYEKTAKSPIKIYLAGGWFNDEQKELIDFLESSLDSKDNLEVYSPRREKQIETGTIADPVNRKNVFQANIDNIKNADLIIASTAGKDMGTLFECGYANAIKRPILYVFMTDNPNGFNLMLSESGKVVTNKDDFANAIDILDTAGVKSEELDKYEYNGATE